MKKLLSIMLLLLLSGCSFHVQKVTPDISNALTPINAQPDVSTFHPTEIPPPTLDVNATNDFIATKSAAGTVPTEALQNVGAFSIQFAPNGTYVDLSDSLSANQAKTYTLVALKGQVMSVSINQGFDGNWTVVPLQITGADGVVLCDPIIFNIECYFWRGILPSTQEYFIKLMPTTNVPSYTLRVAIDPPGTTTQLFQYASPKQNAHFTYQDDFAPARFPGPIVGKVDSEFALQLIDSSFYDKTNLVEAYLLFGSSNDGSVVADCTQPGDVGGEQVNGEITVNNHVFVRSDGAGVGAGNAYVHTAYRTVVSGTCYEMIFFYHYGNIGNYDPSLGIREFDENALIKRFEAILATLTIP